MHGIKGIGIALLLMLAMISAFAAQESSVILEKAIYSEETLGKLDEAINLYQKIVNAADTSRSTAALALYRLGMCYRKSGREEEARSAFTRLAELYPERKDLIQKSQALELGPAPWADGELLRMGSRSRGSKDETGIVTYRAESTQEAGKAAWNLRYVSVSMGISIYEAAVVDAISYLPISSSVRYSFMQRDSDVRYAPEQAEVSSFRNGTRTKSQIPLSGAVYDDTQILYLLRSLPLREGFQTIIPIFYPGMASTASARFSVVSRETITVPAGTFDSFKTVFTPGNNSLERIIWFSTDGHFYPVKILEGGATESELKSINLVAKNQQAHFEDTKLGFRITAPSQWYFGSILVGGLVCASAPELDSMLAMYVWDRRPNQSVAQVLDNWIEDHTAHYQGYTPGTREAILIAGLPGERFVADTMDGSTGAAMVEYTYAFSSSTKKYVFVFKTGKDNFDKMKPEFESIISSIGIQ
jgi:hypothetical protein